MNHNLLACLLTVAMAGCAGTLPGLGVHDGRLTPCPDTPNCVNSQATGGHFIEPISYIGTAREAMDRLVQLLKTEKRVVLVTVEPAYIHATFTSLVFRFVDDVEFYFPDEPVIHVRSASRVGHSDLGANRRRIEHIRNRFAASEKRT
ncbi:DUF1499 domain-containing protein [Desulfosudis oleivorans]|uniref:DUF1499 domain-containing protein n=1 Tax=Desulfosudis oleivorans (strain DSM 6200 / JCM 39069 / Hxd3) TaxID=96561 RepID=A8ZWL5_DESOH|nr:DUF1499 domain-containing protein [Desulfosudis oleivorans]ABW68346.1 protein of unknown function DUF1499 [Desulfosudis oleivorans Hxd3]